MNRDLTNFILREKSRAESDLQKLEVNFENLKKNTITMADSYDLGYCKAKIVQTEYLINVLTDLFKIDDESSNL